MRVGKESWQNLEGMVLSPAGRLLCDPATTEGPGASKGILG